MKKKLLKKIRKNIEQYGYDREKGKKINLNKCNKGDILISTHGAILEYVGKTEDWEYLPHRIKYISTEDPLKPLSGYGTRTNDGFVFKKNRIPSDHDISRIIKKEDLEN